MEVGLNEDNPSIGNSGGRFFAQGLLAQGLLAHGLLAQGPSASCLHVSARHRQAQRLNASPSIGGCDRLIRSRPPLLLCQLRLPVPAWWGLPRLSCSVELLPLKKIAGQNDEHGSGALAAGQGPAP